MASIIETEEHGSVWRVSMEGDSLPELFGAIAKFVGETNPCATGVPGEWEFVSLTAAGPEQLMAGWIDTVVEKARTESQIYAQHRALHVAVARDGRSTLEGWIRCEPSTSWSSPLQGISAERIRVEAKDGRWHAELQFEV